MDRRVAQGRSPLASDAPLVVALRRDRASAPRLVAIALVVYTLSHPYRYYNHFEWQALAFLEGQAAIRYPVEATRDSPGNAFFQDVLPVPSADGVAARLVPVPAPAGGPAHAVRRALGPRRRRPADLRDPRRDRRRASRGGCSAGCPIRTWVRRRDDGLLRLRDGLLVRRPDRDDLVPGPRPRGRAWRCWRSASRSAPIGMRPRSEDDLRTSARRGPRRSAPASTPAPAAHRRARRLLALDRRQFLAGLLFGLACTSRLTVVFAAPFFVLVGVGGTWSGAAVSAALGAAIPIGAAASLYNVVSTGHVFHPGYQYLYELEAGFYTPLHYNLDWGIEDLRVPPPESRDHVSQHAGLVAPNVVPARRSAAGGPLCIGPGRRPRALRPRLPARPAAGHRDEPAPHEPRLPPRAAGASAGASAGAGWSTGAGLAVLIVAFVNLMHFSQGWVQFGYRFSLDFAPWALLLVAIGLERIAARTGGRPSSFGAVALARGIAGRSLALALVGLAVLLVVGSILVNLWGVVWGDALGW